MRSIAPLLLTVVFFCCGLSSAGLNTNIYYTLENISGNQWIYHYTVSNSGLVEGIEEFTIWFEYGKYELIQNESAGLDGHWDLIVWQPGGVTQQNGAFDALAIINPIMSSESESGFAASFTWDGTGDPGNQYYEIINPDNTSQVLDSGFTILVPEPSTMLLLVGLSGCFAVKQ